jgi:hypothetical protein
MVKFIDVFCFVWFTVFLVFWGVEMFTNTTGDKGYVIYVGFMFVSHILLVAAYLYKILKNIKGEST